VQNDARPGDRATFTMNMDPVVLNSAVSADCQLHGQAAVPPWTFRVIQLQRLDQEATAASLLRVRPSCSPAPPLNDDSSSQFPSSGGQPQGLHSTVPLELSLRAKPGPGHVVAADRPSAAQDANDAALEGIHQFNLILRASAIGQSRRHKHVPYYMTANVDTPPDHCT
jgi:hypothetical protein